MHMNINTKIKCVHVFLQFTLKILFYALRPSQQLSNLNEEDHFTITLLSCLSIITYLTNGEKRGQAMTSATLQLFLEGNPDSTLKNFFRRPFLQKPSTIASNTMEENTPAATTTSLSSLDTFPGTIISSNSRGRGNGLTRTNRGTWFRGYKRGNFYPFQPFHRGHPYHQNYRPRGPRHPAAFNSMDNRKETL